MSFLYPLYTGELNGGRNWTDSIAPTGDGAVRNTMVCYFPNSAVLESTIRVGGYKLVRNYQHLPADVSELEIYRLYDSTRGAQLRINIEEANDLAALMPQKAQLMNQQLTSLLAEVEVSYP